MEKTRVIPFTKEITAICTTEVIVMQHKLLARYPIGNPRRKWKQDNFILSIANPGPMGLDIADEFTLRKVRRAVRTCTDAGFNMLECLWASPAVGMEIVRAAESAGNRVVFQNLKCFGGMGLNNPFCETNDLESAMEQMRPWKSVAGFYMWDEPCLDDQIRETRRMVDLCEEKCPDKLAFTVGNPSYHPNFRWNDGTYVSYIDRLADIIDPAQLSFDYYPIGLSEYAEDKQLDGSHMWHDLEVVRRAAEKREMPMWFYYQGQKYHFHKREYAFHYGMVRMMAYAGVLHGVKGLQCYTEFEGPVNPEDGGPGVFFAEQKQLHSEIRALNDTLMALSCDRVIHDSTLLAECPVMANWRASMEESELLEGELRPRLSVSEHHDAYGNRYLMVLNRDYETDAHVQLTLKNPSHVYKVSREDGEQRPMYLNAKKMQLHLAPGTLELYRIQPGEEEPFTVEYYLEKDAR